MGGNRSSRQGGGGGGGGSSRSTAQPTAWSAWIEDPDGRGWYCWRKGINGQTEYDYATKNTSEPRSMEDSLSGLNLSSNNNSQPSSSSPIYGLYGSANSGSAYTSTSPTSGSYAQNNNISSSGSDYPTPTNSYTASSSASNSGYGQSSYQGGGRQYPQNSQTTPIESFSTTSSGNPYPGPSSFQQSTGYQQPLGQPYGQQYGQPYPQNYQQNYQGGQGSSTQGPGTQIPEKEMKIQAKYQPKVNLQGFKLHNSKSFKPGHVFKVFWSEPMGRSTSGITDVTQDEVEDVAGKTVYQSIRRFVIVANDRGHSQCVPILTYGKQGLTKFGVKPEEHAIIYTAFPETLPGENFIGKNAIRMIPKTPQDKLNNASRVNFAKTYTVEHNLPVMFIGQIADKDQKQFSHYWEEQWSNKTKFG